MATSSDKTNPVDARAVFLGQLEQRVAAIEENWGNLRADRWDSELLKSLYDRVHELAEAASQFRLIQFGENVFSAEVYLSSFVDASRPPSPEQSEEIDGLIRLLRTAAEELTQPQAAVPEEPDTHRTIYLLYTAESPLEQVGQALLGHGCEVVNSGDAEFLVAEMGKRQPDAIVADTALLAKFAPLSSEITRLEQQSAVKIPLAFVSGSNSLKVRVEAMRAGGDAYFVAPFDIASIANQIIRLSEPQHPEAYRILVVEDDLAQAEFTTAILHKAGMETSTVTEPLRIMEALENFRPDLILMDIYMPDINGIELTSIIREDPDFHTIPIVFVSGEQNPEKQLDALSVGGDDFIAKPIKPKHLVGVVQNRIRRSINMRRAAGVDKTHDRVTGLLSRRHFLDSISRTIETPPEGYQTAVIHISPDQLNEIRDQHGLGASDTLMASLGNLIGRLIGPGDLACRIKDDGVAVMAHRATERELHEFAAHLGAAIATQPFSVNDQNVQLTASVGVCLFDDTLSDPTGMAIRAETACEVARGNGGNTVTVFEPPRSQSGPVASQVDPTVLRLRAALRGDGFTLRYQPLLHVYERGREFYELLLKLPMPNGDLLAEREFREAAEQAGLSVEIDRWLVDFALSLLKKRADDGRHPTLFVSQSQSTAIDPEYPAWLASRLRAQQMVGTGLVLCYRIADLSRDLKVAMRNHRELKALDIDICVSRFPEKPAAFKVLNFLRAKYIQVAPRLLKADAATIGTVVEQVHATGAKVIVSNIDDPRSVDLHWSSGADLLQGNFIQRPLEHMDYDFYQVVV